MTISRDGANFNYEIEISYKDCRYDLSHLTVEIPDCFEILSYYNSMDWSMDYTALDPTTGVTGIKVDDIHGLW